MNALKNKKEIKDNFKEKKTFIIFEELKKVE